MRKSSISKEYPVEKLKTRRCVVRLQRMKTQTSKTTRSTAAAKGPTPLKKRQVTGTIISTPTNSMKAKERLKTPVVQRNIKIASMKKSVSPVVDEIPPTIAAGRSRRAHKPNPKYASEDILTPKIIKPSRKENDTEKKQRRTSASSIDDFFNKDSTDEDFDENDDDTEEDKHFKISKQDISDSDFADVVDDSDGSILPHKKGPGRPRKLKPEPPQKRTTNTISTNLNKSAPTLKTLPVAKNTTALRTPPSQLQQLRRTLGANTVSPLALGRKRKIEDSNNDTPITVAPKRYLLSSGKSKPIVSSGIVTRRNSPSQSFNNNNKTSTPPHTQKREVASVIEKKIISHKTTPHVLNSKAFIATKQQQQQKNMSPSSEGPSTSVRGSASRVTLPTKQLSTPSPIATSRATASKPKTTESNAKDRLLKKGESQEKESGVDDFETMPTFTIVNINDIINKKGDVLISKTPATKNPSPATQRRNSTAVQQTSNKALAKKPIPGHLKSSHFRTSTPLTKRPPEKNVSNQSAFNKNIGKNLVHSTSFDDKKPAPRILNSVVGRRTKPVKPMIANLDISTDSPSCSLSLYEDDDDEELDDDSKIGGSSSNETETLEPSKYFKRKLSVATKNKNIEPKVATKENSLAATNVQPSIQTQTQSKLSDSKQLSPEKVSVSRQGDKIIKKITCFETWYVINIPAEAPEEYERNNLNMPLIELANANKSINLPSEMWTTKVTLYELSSLTLSKSKLATYTGDLSEQNIAEEDRHKYQPSCVMFRRIVADRVKSQLPYDRAVIFKNKTFFTNIEGKNVKLVGAPSTISQVSEVETLLHIVDSLTLQSSLVEPAATVA